MVVDHVEHHSQPVLVAGIDEPFQSLRAAVGVLYGIRVDAVIPPVAAAGKLGHRHQLDGGDTELDQVVKALDDSVEGTRRCECSHMQLVNDILTQRSTAPAAILPVRNRVDDL